MVTRCHTLCLLLAPLPSHHQNIGFSSYLLGILCFHWLKSHEGPPGDGLWKVGRSPEPSGQERPACLSASSSYLLPEGEKANFWNRSGSPNTARAAGAGGRAVKFPDPRGCNHILQPGAGRQACGFQPSWPEARVSRLPSTLELLPIIFPTRSLLTVFLCFYPDFKAPSVC